MRSMLLRAAASCAVLAVAAVPAQAQRWSDPNFIAAANVSVHRGSPDGGWSARDGRGGDHWRGERRDRRHRDRNRNYPVFISDYGYQEDNPAWQADGFNDWWHERSSRNTPRWVRQNRDCERMWSSGSGWRC